MSDMDAAVEAAARAQVNRAYRAVTWELLPLDAQARWIADTRAALEAARPLLPEAKALTKVKALCEKWEATGESWSCIAAGSVRKAIAKGEAS